MCLSQTKVLCLSPVDVPVPNWSWYTPAEVLRLATGTNAELLALSGPRNPYPGKLGVVEQGALADLLLVDGDPIENIELIADPAHNFVLIMKDGRIYKDTLQ